MKTIIKKKQAFSTDDNLILLCDKKSNLSEFNLSKDELNYIQKEQKEDNEIITINQYNRLILVVNPKADKNVNKHIEDVRLLGDKLQGILKDKESVIIIDVKGNQTEVLAIAEGMALANYTFTTHKTDPKPNKLTTLYLCNKASENDTEELQNIVDAVYLTRDLINEPFSHMTAKDLADAAVNSGKKNGVNTTVFNKKKIETLKMGGLLAVNKGSIDEPTFTIMEYKPKNATNQQPIILVGKGIVYDTGGLSLKPTANSMDLMKTDMGGSGVVIGAMNAIAANKLDKYVIALIPATDNRPSGNAYAPGDVITMYDGTTVEVLNTDAEGRLIMADALSYANQYKPELVIDIATLTGSAVAAIGHYGIVGMGNMEEKTMSKLKESGNNVFERIAEFPFWDEYNEQLKSPIADLTNLGNGSGGSITAGKFLENFTDYPYVHLDIAGPAFLHAPINYLSKGGTGVGVRLFYDFVKNY